jgi:hypothetical protein
LVEAVLLDDDVGRRALYEVGQGGRAARPLLEKQAVTGVDSESIELVRELSLRIDHAVQSTEVSARGCSGVTTLFDARPPDGVWALDRS